MTGAPKVSVVVPVHNRETYVRDAIASILAQSFGDYELLVIDDGSTDGSRAAAQAFDDARIRLVGNDANEGIPKTRNIAVGLARGEYLAFLDSDDIALPNRLARQVAYLDGHPDHAAVGAWVAWMDDGGRPLGRIKRLATTAEDIAAQRLFRPGIVNSAAMARTAVLRGFPHREDFRVGSDFEMWARFAGAHRIANLPEVLVRCRVHGDRTTVALAEQVKSVRFAIYRPQLAALGRRVRRQRPRAPFPAAPNAERRLHARCGISALGRKLAARAARSQRNRLPLSRARVLRGARRVLGQGLPPRLRPRRPERLAAVPLLAAQPGRVAGPVAAGAAPRPGAVAPGADSALTWARGREE